MSLDCGNRHSACCEWTRMYPYKKKGIFPMKLLKTRFFTIAVAALVLALTLAALPVVISAEEGTELTNVALNKTVESNNSFEAGFFGAYQLTDGSYDDDFGAAYDGANTPLGWHNDTNMAGTSSVDNPTYLTINLGGWYEISSAKLIPMAFYHGDSGVSTIARDFDLQVSTDGENWTTVHSATDVSCLWGADDPLVYEFEAVEASMFRMTITRDSGFNGGYTTLGEIEVYGVEIEAPETTAPETTAPETTAPETTAPETTAPETTAAETTAAGTTAAETTAAATEPVAETTAAAQSSAGCFGLVGTGAAAALVVLAGAAWVCRKKD